MEKVPLRLPIRPSMGKFAGLTSTTCFPAPKVVLTVTSATDTIKVILFQVSRLLNWEDSESVGRTHDMIKMASSHQTPRCVLNLQYMRRAMNNAESAVNVQQEMLTWGPRFSGSVLAAPGAPSAGFVDTIADSLRSKGGLAGSRREMNKRGAAKLSRPGRMGADQTLCCWTIWWLIYKGPRVQVHSRHERTSGEIQRKFKEILV